VKAPAATPDTIQPGAAASSLSTADLLAELGRRFRVRFGRLEVVYHDGLPSPRVLVEHRVQRAVDDHDGGSLPRPATPRRAKP
jgi:hypothetical protein